MRKQFPALLLILVLFLCLPLLSLGEVSTAVKVELRTDRLPVFERGASGRRRQHRSVHDRGRGDPLLSGLLKNTDDAENMPVLLLPLKNGFELTATVSPKTLSNRRVALSVADESIVRVRGNYVSGLKTGETVLTISSAYDPSAFQNIRVLVIQRVNRISVSASEKTVTVGGTVRLTPAFQPEVASIQAVKWSSENTSIATVDENGVVTGLKRGYVRIIANALDGSGTRANVSMEVTQGAESITLDRTEVTVDAGRNTVVHATVLPQNTNDKRVTWTTSDKNIATVNEQGRVTGVSVGTCDLICTSKVSGKVEAKARVFVNQPVKDLTFGPAPVVYVDSKAKLSWNVIPENASNKSVTFQSSDERILKVSSMGVVTGVKAGEATVNAITTDGTNHRARLKMTVFQHAENIHMKRQYAYINVKESDTCTAVFEPDKYTNHNMTWESSDPSVATVAPLEKMPNRVRITGVSEGETVVTGTAEDGGLTTSIVVRIGEWDHAVALRQATLDGNGIHLSVENTSDLTITAVTAEIIALDRDGNPVPCNSRDNSGTFRMVYRETLNPGESTKAYVWKTLDYMQPQGAAAYEVKITQYQIDDDWIRMIQKFNQPKKKLQIP